MRAQSVAEAARAAKEKKKKQAAAAPAQPTTRPKVYTNDEIPESKTSDSQPAPSKTAESKTSSSDAKSTTASTQADLPHGPDSAHVDFKFTSGTLKRPAKAETVWSVKNTSDHFERVEIKTIINGPCGYHREDPGAGPAELTSGSAITTSWQAELSVLATDCRGTYTLELRASVAGKLLDSASDSITFE